MMNNTALTDEAETEALLTDADVADILRVRPSTIRTWRRENKGPRWVKLGYNVIRYRREDDMAWVAEQKAA